MQALRNLWVQLQGRKTYLATIALGVTGLANSFGWIDQTTANALYAIFGTAAGLSIRSAMNTTRTDSQATVDLPPKA